MKATFLVMVLSKPIHSSLLGIYISEETSLLLKNLSNLVQKYGKHKVYADGGRWYDQADKIIRLKPIWIYHCRRV